MGNNHTYLYGICFFVEIGFFNYTEAMVNCQTQFGSNNTGKLFEPRDASTNDQVIKFAKETILPSTSFLHIGINDMATEGTWQYATGGDLVYTNWANLIIMEMVKIAARLGLAQLGMMATVMTNSLLFAK